MLHPQTYFFLLWGGEKSLRECKPIKLAVTEQGRSRHVTLVRQALLCCLHPSLILTFIFTIVHNHRKRHNYRNHDRSPLSEPPIVSS